MNAAMSITSISCLHPLDHPHVVPRHRRLPPRNHLSYPFPLRSSRTLANLIHYPRSRSNINQILRKLNHCLPCLLLHPRALAHLGLYYIVPTRRLLNGVGLPDHIYTPLFLIILLRQSPEQR